VAQLTEQLKADGVSELAAVTGRRSKLPPVDNGT